MRVCTGSCGSCWAFAAVSAIESASAILTDELYALSEQQVRYTLWKAGM
jgi:C1A family cysteine protease